MRAGRPARCRSPGQGARALSRGARGRAPGGSTAPWPCRVRAPGLTRTRHEPQPRTRHPAPSLTTLHRSGALPSQTRQARFAFTYTLRPSLGGRHPCNRSVPKTHFDHARFTMHVVRARDFAHSKWAFFIAQKWTSTCLSGCEAPFGDPTGEFEADGPLGPACAPRRASPLVSGPWGALLNC